MPSYLDLGMQSLVGSARSEIIENIQFLDKTLASMKIMTLMLSRMMPIPDSCAKLASTDYSVSGIQLGGAIIARLYYNQIYGRPEHFKYNIDRLRIIYDTFDLPWDESVAKDGEFPVANNPPSNNTGHCK